MHWVTVGCSPAHNCLRHNDKLESHLEDRQREWECHETLSHWYSLSESMVEAVALQSDKTT